MEAERNRHKKAGGNILSRLSKNKYPSIAPDEINLSIDTSQAVTIIGGPTFMLEEDQKEITITDDLFEEVEKITSEQIRAGYFLGNVYEVQKNKSPLPMQIPIIYRNIGGKRNIAFDMHEVEEVYNPQSFDFSLMPVSKNELQSKTGTLMIEEESIPSSIAIEIDNQREYLTKNNGLYRNTILSHH